MKRSDICPNKLVKQLNSISEQINVVQVSHFSTPEANQIVTQISSAVEALTALRSRTALHIARSHPEPDGESGRQRIVRNLFDDGSLTRREVKHEVAKTKVLDHLPTLENNLNKVKASNLDVVAKQVGRLGSEQISQLDEKFIVKKATTMAPDQFEKALSRHVTEATTNLLDDTKAKRAASEINLWVDNTTGLGKLFGQFDPERHEILHNRIDKEASRLANIAKAEAGSTSNVTKDAHLMAEAFFSLLGIGHSHPNTRRLSTQSLSDTDSTVSRALPAADLLVIVDHNTLVNGRHANTVAETESGVKLPDETVARLACDATIRRIETDSKGLVLNVGRKSRTATDAQWAAAKTMYPACAWAGCSTKIGHCQLHHIKYWRNGGQTNMTNLVPLCSHHHHKVHEGGWHLKLKPDRSLEHYKPDKSLWKTTKPPNRLAQE